MCNTHFMGQENPDFKLPACPFDFRIFRLPYPAGPEFVRLVRKLLLTTKSMHSKNTKSYNLSISTCTKEENSHESKEVQ